MILLASILAASGLIAWAMFRNNSSILYPTLYRRKNEHKNIALTFDDGPNPECTPRVLEILKKYNIKATFFCIGHLIEKYPQIAQKIHEDGHLIGNHCYEHSLKSFFYHPSKTEELIIKTGNAICRITGYFPSFYRPPAGIKTPPRIIAGWRLGLNFAGWALKTFDGSMSVLSDKKAMRIIRKTRGGDVILLHDNSISLNGSELNSSEHSEMLIKNLPLIIESLRKKGFDFVKLDKLFYISPALSNSPIEKKNYPDMSFTALSKEFFYALINEKASPFGMALALAVGIFIGCSPLFGLHTLIGFAVAMRFGIHKIAVFLGTNISNPFSAPFVIWLSIKTGWAILYDTEFTLTIRYMDLHSAEQLLREYALCWLIGFPVVGLLFAIIGFIICYPILTLRQFLSKKK